MLKKTSQISKEVSISCSPIISLNNTESFIDLLLPTNENEQYTSGYERQGRPIEQLKQKKLAHHERYIQSINKFHTKRKKTSLQL